MITFSNLLVLFIGGGFGTICRWLIHIWLSRPGELFPVATLIANVISSLLIGFLIAYFLRHNNDLLRLLFITGYCGGFSTFSTFSMENYQLMVDGRWMMLAIYISLSVLLCVFSVMAGMRLGDALS